VLAFFQAAYDATATLGRWDRASLDRPTEASAAGAAGYEPEQPSP
jgi:hypothetical protein